MAMSSAVDPTDARPKLDWLARYASKDSKHQWQRIVKENRVSYHRPLGLVERTFDSDGRFFEGRADVNGLLTLEVRSPLSDSALRERILDTWSSVRLYHPILRAKALPIPEIVPSEHEKSNSDIHFLIEKPQSLAAAREEAVLSTTFLNEHYDSVNAHEFYVHSQNAKRIVDPEGFLAKFFVLPFETGESHSNTRSVSLLVTAAHQITDGLSMINWLSHFIILLNNPAPLVNLDEIFSPKAVQARFPLAQETLYPQISNSIARQRWFWAITLVMRHVHTPVQQGFPNPLRRHSPFPSGSPPRMPHKFSAVLDYSTVPPLNTGFTGMIRLSRRATRRLHRLCRAAGTSIGAGTFALAAAASMEFEEQRNPKVPLDERKPFVASFPLNPRAMFAHSEPADSLMLAFSEGIKLPFLPSYLPIEGRFKLLARAAHRQLRVYQKRAPRTVAEEAEKNPLRILAVNYIMSLERSQYVLPPELRMADSRGPQADLPAPSAFGRATHGVSAVGALQGVLRRGCFPLDSDKEFAADYRSYATGVKARDDEFLCGTIGEEDHLCFSVSYDGNAIDHDLVEEWKSKIVSLLDFGEEEKL